MENNNNMEYNCTSPLLVLAMKFKTKSAFDTGYTCLNGNNFKFDNHKDALTLLFFTDKQLEGAVFQVQAAGLVEGVDFTLEDSM